MYNYCQKCGNRLEHYEVEYCKKCGNKLIEINYTYEDWIQQINDDIFFRCDIDGKNLFKNFYEEYYGSFFKQYIVSNANSLVRDTICAKLDYFTGERKRLSDNEKIERVKKIMYDSDYFKNYLLTDIDCRKIRDNIKYERIIREIKDVDIQKEMLCMMSEHIEKEFLADIESAKRFCNYKKNIDVNEIIENCKKKAGMKIGKFIQEIADDELKVEALFSMVKTFGENGLTDEIILCIEKDENRFSLIQILKDTVSVEVLKTIVDIIKDYKIKKQAIEVVVDTVGKEYKTFLENNYTTNNNIINIYTNKQLKTVPKNFDGTIIVRGGEYEFPIVIEDTYFNAEIVLSGNSYAIVKNQDIVKVLGASNIKIVDCKYIVVEEEGIASVYGDSKIVMGDNARVILNQGSFELKASGRSIVYAFRGCKGDIIKDKTGFNFEEVDLLNRTRDISFSIKLEEGAKFCSSGGCAPHIENLIYNQYGHISKIYWDK